MVSEVQDGRIRLARKNIILNGVPEEPIAFELIGGTKSDSPGGASNSVEHSPYCPIRELSERSSERAGRRSRAGNCLGLIVLQDEVAANQDQLASHIYRSVQHSGVKDGQGVK